MECHKGFERCSFEFHLPSSCVSPTLTREHSPSKMAWPAKRFLWRSWQRDATLERRRTKSLGEYSEGRKVFLSNQLIHLLHVYSPYDFCNYFQFFFFALINSYISPRMALKFPTSLFPGGISLNFERTSKWFVLWRRARWCGDPTLDPEGLGNRAFAPRPSKGPVGLGRVTTGKQKKNTAYQPRWLFWNMADTAEFLEYKLNKHPPWN